MRSRVNWNSIWRKSEFKSNISSSRRKDERGNITSLQHNTIIKKELWLLNLDLVLPFLKFPYGHIDVQIRLACFLRLSGFELSNPLWHTINCIFHILWYRFLLKRTILIHHLSCEIILYYKVKISTDMHICSFRAFDCWQQDSMEEAYFWNIGAVRFLWSHGPSGRMHAWREQCHATKPQEWQLLVYMTANLYSLLIWSNTSGIFEF
jgi:hypothetical protein